MITLHLEDPFDRGDHVEISARLRKKHPKLVCADGKLWEYSDAGVWVDDAERRLAKEIANCAGAILSASAKTLKIRNGDVIGVLEMLRRELEDAEFFRKAPAGVACANGFVTLGGLIPHSPENRARGLIPFEYDPNADQTEWYEFLGELFEGSSDGLERIDLLSEVFGAALFGLATGLQRCLVLRGDGSDGKSTLINAVKAVFPSDSVTALGPEDWGDRFRTAGLVGSRLNVVGEIPGDAVLNADAFKKVIVGDMITGERKHQAPFSFAPIAGHVFACNSLPRTKDQSYGFWRRFLVVEFPRRFAVDLRVEKKLATMGRAILRWVVEGGQRAAKAGEYSIPPSHQAAVIAWKNDVDTVHAFVFGVGGGWDGKATKAAELHPKYLSWAIRNGHKQPVNSTHFGTRIKTYEEIEVTKPGGVVTYRRPCGGSVEG